jgi:hypothetical protein
MHDLNPCSRDCKYETGGDGVWECGDSGGGDCCCCCKDDDCDDGCG